MKKLNEIFRHNNYKAIPEEVYQTEGTVPVTQLVYPMGNYGSGIEEPKHKIKVTIAQKGDSQEERGCYTTEDKTLLLTRKNSDDAGLDIKALLDTTIPAHGDAIVQTGIRVQIPRGYVGILKSRSGLSVNHKIEVGAGVIDSNYRGEIKVHLYNFSNGDFFVQNGERIAQLIIFPYYMPKLELVYQLDDTERGEKGFGSSGI